MNALTDRAKVIQAIEQLYPPDSHEEGLEIMVRALAERWRDLPGEVLNAMLAMMTAKDGGA